MFSGAAFTSGPVVAFLWSANKPWSDGSALSRWKVSAAPPLRGPLFITATVGFSVASSTGLLLLAWPWCVTW